MKKRVLMSLVLLAIIGTSAVFAQTPTLDKLKFAIVSNNRQYAEPANKSISGAVVIPGTYNSMPVQVANFYDCTQITSVTILDGATHISDSVGTFRRCSSLTSVTLPASVTNIGSNAFMDCDKLTSVTFLGNTIATIGNNVFPGDLSAKYKAGGAGTYTRPAGSNTWTKQGGFTLNGTWKRSDGMEITISGDGTQTFTITGNAPNNGGRFNRNFAER
jgi:hypothetical protein